MKAPIAMAAWALVLQTTLSLSPAAAAAPATTLCRLAADPAKWRGRIVHLTATYITDRIERSLLKDDRCPRIWFAPWDSKKGDRGSLEAFNRAVAGDGRSVHTTHFIVEIIGRVSYRREGGSSGRIRILSVLGYREIASPGTGGNAGVKVQR